MTASYLIVVSELPEVRDTLLLRLMGAGKTLMTAIAELDRLPPAAPERLLAMPIVLRLRLEVPADPTRRSRDEQEFFMSTQDILEVWTQNAENEGIRKGLAEAVLSLYEMRFGAPPAEITAVVRRTRDLDVLRGWFRTVNGGSAAEIAAALRDGNAS